MTTPAPIRTHVITPDAPKQNSGVNPNATRYGWCPFMDINLVNGFGTFEYYVQPEGSPYHRTLPKNQLIPFITFQKNTEVDDANSPSTPKNPNPKTTVSETKTALEAATTILFSFSAWGFKILNSLEGLDQETAIRIFTVVQPFHYPLGEIVHELSFGAMQRIASGEDLVFQNVEGYPEGYVVEALQSDGERTTAHKLVAEMLDGAETAVALATETLDKTDESKITRISSGKGKTTDDPLDRHLSAEMGRQTVRPVGNDKSSNVEKKVDFLVDREISREQREENERLRKENGDLRAQMAANKPAEEAPTEELQPEAGPKPVAANTRAKSKIIE